MAFGPSITVPLDLVHRYNPATPEGFQPARDLTAIFEQALKSLTINTPDWATLKVLHTAREVYVPENVELTPAQYLEITNHMVADYKIMAQKNPAAVEPVRKMLEEYQLKLDILRLTDREVAGKFERVNLSPAMLVLTFVLWPLALIGTALNLPIAIGAAIGGARLARVLCLLTGRASGSSGQPTSCSLPSFWPPWSTPASLFCCVGSTAGRLLCSLHYSFPSLALPRSTSIPWPSRLTSSATPSRLCPRNSGRSGLRSNKRSWPLLTMPLARSKVPTRTDSSTRRFLHKPQFTVGRSLLSSGQPL